MAKDKKDKPQRVKPQVLKGFRDYPPDEQIARERMLAKVRETCELMGFLPLQTASLEFAETLLGPHYNEDSLAELFGFEGPDEVSMALRYEFTVSLARYVASQPNLALPFRRYQYGNVWRVDKPGPGRFREFMQFDIDIVGTKNLLADAEIIAAMVNTMKHLGVENSAETTDPSSLSDNTADPSKPKNSFKVRYSSRKILNGLIEWAKIRPDKGPDVMRVLDKLEKQGREAVLDELGKKERTDESGAIIPGLNLETEKVDALSKFINEALEGGQAYRAFVGRALQVGADKNLINKESPEEFLRKQNDPLEWVATNLGNVAIAMEGLSDLRTIQDHLRNLGISEKEAGVDLTIVRGLGYYTGAVFETTLLDLPEFGSVFSGGRYDNLVGRFQAQQVPGVGASIGIDRLLAALIKLEKLQLTRATSKVLVTVMDSDRLPDYLSILKELRAAGIPSEIFVGDTKNLTKQVKYGDKVGIPFAVIIGSDEFASGQVTVKNLAAGAYVARATDDREEWLKAEGFQETISRDQLIPYLKKKLSQ